MTEIQRGRYNGDKFHQYTPDCLEPLWSPEWGLFPVSAFVETYRSRHGLGVSATVHAALKVVRDAGVVEREGDVYRVGDPFFARYVRRSCAEVGGV